MSHHHPHEHSHSHGHEHSHEHAHEHHQGPREHPGHEHPGRGDDVHGHAQGHGATQAMVEEEEDIHGPQSERYELEDLFRGEAPENQHFLKVVGIVTLVVLLALALAYPYLFLS